ncbi:MAG: biotin carboxylase N-terminal domain-containing protein [Parvularculaceae bacterium]|nr:biotin carboxylase N-terminal domain-containing protein [Parvularculaceae bacterium]
MFKKILIANRGEIAVRVARTARRMGVATVAVYSDADAGAPHVRACDEAVRIGTAPPADSYLKIERIIDAMKRTGAQAVHPGYGFLSENEKFADALEAAGLVFIGPTAKTIRAMGSKAAAKDLMEKAGVPTTPGYQGADQSIETFRRECAKIGYPVLLKATAGGGGKGMKIVEKEADLAEQLASAQREGKNSFGDDRVLAEKYVARARHLEVQIVGDGEGKVLHFFERDCSVQRRHQKIIEEAPAPRLPAAVRKRLHDIGVNAGKAALYRGAGTVECLYDGADGVYFMEMNTRLQVEHPVTEEITGVDLVELQLKVAAGEGLALEQKDIREQGHAFEARLYAENPDNNFAPSIGALTTLRLPREERTDSGVEEGQDITPFYDPMIAKIIRHGKTREEALARLRGALAEVRVAGLETNARFLHRLASDADFIAGDVSTRYIADHEATLFAKSLDDTPALAAALADLVLLHPEEARSAVTKDPWNALKGFRLNKPAKWVHWVTVHGEAALARLLVRDGGYDVEIDTNASAAGRRKRADAPPPSPLGRGAGGEGPAADDARNPAAGSLTPNPSPTGRGGLHRFAYSAAREGADIRVTLDDQSFLATVAPHGTARRVFIGAEHADIQHPDVLAGIMGGHSAEGSLNAPMPGVVTLLKAKPGERVAAGAVLLVMEAMKMEHAIKAPHDGVVKAFRAKPGDQVKDGALLVEFEES